MLQFAKQAPLPQPPVRIMPMPDYLRLLSTLPDALRPPKPARFTGSHWRL